MNFVAHPYLDRCHGANGGRGDIRDSGSCTVSAMAAAFNILWPEAHAYLASIGRKTGHGFSMHCAMTRPKLSKYGEAREAKWLYKDDSRARMTVKNFLKVCDPAKRYVVIVSGHTFAVIGGKVRDYTEQLNRRVKWVYEISPKLDRPGAINLPALRIPEPKKIMSKKQTPATDANREAWLLKAVEALSPLFTAHEYKVPAMRVSCGWPSSRGTGKKKIAIGECWDKSAADDKVAQIFISPRFSKACDEMGILPTLAHEMGHAIVGNEEGHNKVFGKCVRAIGLEGKLTSTHGGEAFLAEAKKIVEKIGEYPHAALNPKGRPTKKQTTRLLKCECDACGYNVRVTRKWLEIGAPICPCNNKAMTIEGGLIDGNDEGEE
jgi:hypothetical protein